VQLLEPDAGSILHDSLNPPTVPSPTGGGKIATNASSIPAKRALSAWTMLAASWPRRSPPA
jgi:hypothetical protein